MITLFKECFTWLPLRNYFKNKQYREYVKLLGKYSAAERFKNTNIKFLEYNVEVSDCLSFVNQYKDIFVDGAYNFKASTAAPLIYDCGANYGTSCLYFKSLYPECKIKAFEADPAIAGLLSKNISGNGCANVEIVDKAVWISNDGIEFGVEGADGGSINLPGGRKIKIGSVRLKDSIESEKKIDMLKMDIEGAETEVICDCSDSLHKAENIFIEYHSWNNSPQKLDLLLRVLSENDFRYYIETVCSRNEPFINKREDLNMDMQLNIFAYRRNPLK